MLFAAAAGLTIVACKKEKKEMNNVVQMANLVSEENMDQHILDFKKKLLTYTKSGELIPVGQAEIDLENLLNFDFGDANYATNNLRNDTMYLPMQLTDGMVNIAELSDVYDEAFHQIRSLYRSIDLPEKSVFRVSFSINEETISEGNEVEIVLTTRSYSDIGGSGDTPIGSDFWSRSWRPGYNGGTCDGLYTNYGAARLIQDRLNANIGEYMCIDGSRVYFTNQGRSQIDALNSIMVDPNGIYSEGRRMFYRRTTNPNTVCIDPDELAYYYSQISSFFHNYKIYFTPPIPSNHVPLIYSIEMIGNSTGNQSTSYRWTLTVDHAKPNCTNTPAQD